MFATLDNNRDNRITTDQWQWSRRSFNQYDKNSDGVLAQAASISASTTITFSTTAASTR